MTLISNHYDILTPQPASDPFPKDSQLTLDLQRYDKNLISGLWEKNRNNTRHYSESAQLSFSNHELAQAARDAYDHDSLHHLETLLDQKGTLTIPMLDGFSVSVDGKEHDVTIVAATEIADNIPNHGDMSSMLYLRDHIQAASVFIDLGLQDPERYSQEAVDGRTLLISALHLMSTGPQLDRFNHVIEQGPQAGQADWPHISLHFNDMQGASPNGWRNKQDTFQMLAYTTLEAIERGFIHVEELENAHKEFLGSIVPLLASVGFPKHENSGSWEEIAAHRTSVMSVETALLYKIKKMTENSTAASFFEECYNTNKDKLPESRAGNFSTILDEMITDGLTEIGQRLPYEAPDYDNDSVKFRKADAALTYVLMYDLPTLLAEAHIAIGPQKQILSRPEIEDLVLEQLFTLLDPETNSIIRYEEDSYQRTNFHTNEVQWIINSIKYIVKKSADANGREIDLDKKQEMRGDLTPQGKSAAWTHPLGQISAWAAGRSLKALAEGNNQEAAEYRTLSTQFLNRTLSTITGDNQWHATLDENNRYAIRQVPSYRLPECYISYEHGLDEQFFIPSPHTPLNWSSASAKHAIGLLRLAS